MMMEEPVRTYKMKKKERDISANSYLGHIEVYIGLARLPSATQSVNTNVGEFFRVDWWDGPRAVGS